MPAQRKLIPKKDLRWLYFTEKLSMNEIGMRFGCNHVTIVNRFKEYGWKSRGHRGTERKIGVSKNGLVYLYNKKRLSVDKIARMLGCSEGGLMRKFKQFRIGTRGTGKRISYKYPNKLDFDGTRNLMAYMIGFREGDLNVESTKQIVIVRGSTTIPAQVRLIRNLFKKYGGINVSRAQRGTYEIYCFLNKSFSFLVPKIKKIPRWIQVNRDCFMSFLSGYIDAEGHINVSRKGMEVQTQEKGIIFDSWKLLNKFGIICNKPLLSKKGGYIDNRGIRNNKDCWRLSLYKRSELLKFIGEYQKYVRHEHKKKAVELVLQQLLQCKQIS